MPEKGIKYRKKRGCLVGEKKEENDQTKGKKKKKKEKKRGKEAL
mgnify:CR=1 FL=1